MQELRLIQNKKSLYSKTIRNLFLVVSFVWSLTSGSVLSQDEQLGTPIEIIGVSGSIKENIEIHLGLEDEKIPLSAVGFPRSNEFILRKTQQAMQALGYYKPEISLQGDHTGWRLEINKGLPVVWSSADLKIIGEGESYPRLQSLSNNHPFKQGSIVNHGQYRAFKTQLQTVSQESGFLAVVYEQSQFEVSVEESNAKLIWRLNTHQRYRFNQVSVTGSNLAQSFVERYISIKSGEFYSYEDIINTQQALNRSGYFNAVSVTQAQDNKNNQVDISIELTDIEKYELKTKLGYGTDTGGKIGVSWQDRQVNDKGHQYIFSVDLSEIEKATSFQYKQPISGNKNQWINRYSYRIKNEDLAETKLSTLESQVSLVHNEHWSSQSTLTLSFESVTSQADIDSYLSYLIPSWQVNYYSVEDPFKAQTGWRWQSEIRVSDDSLSDPDIRFVQLEQRLKSIWALSDKWRLLARANIGYTDMDNVNFNARMPSTYRFYAGGDVSVRGYEYQTLSPKDSSGIILGGKHLLTSSLELDWQFSDAWRWALFADSGSAFNDWQSMDQRGSIGTGFRWITPVGSIRLDYAKALDEDKGWRFHITIGPDL
jgi:translocation and assembly module TamA